MHHRQPASFHDTAECRWLFIDYFITLTGHDLYAQPWFELGLCDTHTKNYKKCHFESLGVILASTIKMPCHDAIARKRSAEALIRHIKQIPGVATINTAHATIGRGCLLGFISRWVWRNFDHMRLAQFSIIRCYLPSIYPFEHEHCISIYIHELRPHWLTICPSKQNTG
jgi:hypothetical protein